MKKGNTKQLTRTNYLLELNVDFQANDLEDFINGTKILNNEVSKKIALDLGGECVWSGHYDKHTQTVKIQVEQELFI